MNELQSDTGGEFLRQSAGSLLSQDEAAHKRNQLVEKGYCVVPGVLRGEFLDELRAWSDELLAKTIVPHKHRYQGSDIHVSTQRRYEAGR